MKRCPKNHDNPDNAKFCRICGYNFDNSFNSRLKNYWNTLISLVTRVFNTMINESKTRLASMRSSSGFTPDMFPCINLNPRSVAKVDFQCKKGIAFMAVLIVLFVALGLFSEKLGSLLYSAGMPYEISYGISPCVALLLFIIFLFKFIPFLRRINRWLKYRMNADYIEYSAFMGNFYRIAKKGKLGLFDKSINKVLMGSRYENITNFDSEHILIEKGGKKGLFSMKKMGLIVPIRFDRIEPFKNSIVKCHKGMSIVHYDINGNPMT